MTPEARAKRNAYKRAWYAKNKDKARSYIEAYWERKAAEAKEKEKTNDENRES